MNFELSKKRTVTAGIVLAAGLAFILLTRDIYPRIRFFLAALALLLVCTALTAVKLRITNKYLKIILVALAPAINYIIFECTTGNLLTINGVFLVLNVMFFYLFYVIVFALSNRLRFTILFLNIITYIIALAEYFVVLFRGRPIMIWDVLAIGTAATVAGNYEYNLVYHYVLTGMGMLAVLLLYSNVTFRVKTLKKRLVISSALILFAAVFLNNFYKDTIRRYRLTIDMWSPSASYSTSGYFLSTFVYLDYINVKPPDGYSVEAVRAIEQKIDEEPLELASDGIKPVNIICIMNESLSDLSVINDFRTNQDYMPFLHGLTENTIKGNLYVPIFGSMTCNSEFEFLTGNSIAFLPAGGIAFQIYVNGKTHALPSMLKEIGYDSIAMHPYPGGNWNRDQVYQYMGFDNFMDQEYFKDVDMVRNYVSDKVTYDKIISLIEEKEEGSSLFIFDVTMQNHGGYVGEFENFKEEISLTDYPEFEQTEQYLSLIKRSDEDFEYLLNYLEGIKEPTMVVMFGDHQPSVEPEFFDTLYGKEMQDLTSEEQLRQYITPFVLWTNYETESAYIDKLSCSFLPVLMLEEGNLPMSPYFQYLAKMKEEVPVVHPLGYYNKEDEYHEWRYWKEEKEYPLYKDFYIMQHNNLFDLRRRVDSLFMMPSEGLGEE